MSTNNIFPLTPNWQNFLTNNEKQKAVFCSLEENVTDDTVKTEGKYLVSMMKADTVGSHADYSNELLWPCSHKEADIDAAACN
jgi:hypothetical protein